MATIFQFATRIEYGPGLRHQVGRFIRELRGSRAFLVIDRGLHGLGLAQLVITAVAAEGLPLGVFHDIEADPTELTVDRGVELAARLAPDIIVAIGGGSAICAGKAITMVLSNGGRLVDWEISKNRQPPLPVIALPSTAGSGAKVAPRFLIKDAQTGVKRRYGGGDCFPRLAVLDPELLIDLPAGIAIAASLDALASAIEATPRPRPTPSPTPWPWRPSACWPRTSPPPR